MERLEKRMEALVELMREPLAEGKEIALTIRGNSMWPLLLSGRDKIFIKTLDFYKKYDIILYKRDNGSYVLHRIVGKKNGAFILAGDGEFKKEYPIYENQIAAGAVGGVRKGRPFSCTDFTYRLYSVVWTFLLPVRPYIVRVAAPIRRRLKNVFKKRNK